MTAPQFQQRHYDPGGINETRQAGPMTQYFDRKHRATVARTRITLKIQLSDIISNRFCNQTAENLLGLINLLTG